MMQCKDIPDVPILEHLKAHGGVGCTVWPMDKFDGAPSTLHAFPDGYETPDKLAVAKMKMLIRRGLVDGCTCGCRGDYELTDKGRAFLDS